MDFPDFACLTNLGTTSLCLATPDTHQQSWVCCSLFLPVRLPQLSPSLCIVIGHCELVWAVAHFLTACAVHMPFCAVSLVAAASFCKPCPELSVALVLLSNPCCALAYVIRLDTSWRCAKYLVSTSVRSSCCCCLPVQPLPCRLVASHLSQNSSCVFCPSFRRHCVMCRDHLPTLHRPLFPVRANATNEKM